MTQWRPWIVSRTELLRSPPEDLKVGPGDDFERLPTHADLGAPVDGFIQGRLVAEGLVPSRVRYGRDHLVRQLDTTGDGVADTFVSFAPERPDVPRAVSIGGPFLEKGTRRLGVCEGKIGRVTVRDRDGTQQTFEPGRYERIEPGGRQVQLRDKDGDGRTDRALIGKKDVNASWGWPFIGYERVD